MAFDLSQFMEVVSDEQFDERPVSLYEFVTSPDYMKLPELSVEQFNVIEKMTQIYRPETLIGLYGPGEGEKRSKGTVKEVIAQIGKGGGKNHSTTIAVCRLIYLLLCLKDPAAYYGKPPGDAIDILNVAINSQQANNTFFKPVRERIKRSKWFDGKYDIRSGEIRFDKNITVHSGHSEREAWEGYNFIMVVLDEIAGFKTDSETAGAGDRVNSASNLYKMYKASVTSRFPDEGKLVLLSFPRFKGDFITERYEQVIAEKVVTTKTHDFKINDELPDGVDNNHFSIQWTEDDILSYKEPSVFAAKLPTWEFNPLRSIEDFKMEFWRDPVDAMSRFACNPPDSIDAFFRDREAVTSAFATIRTPFNDDWSFAKDFVPKDDTRYYIHVDLAQKHDRAAVAMSHVSEWVQMSHAGNYQSVEPVVNVDAVRWWTPKSDENVQFDDIKSYILALRSRGFDIARLTFDRWAGSIGLANELSRLGIEVETLSVQKKEYNDMMLLMSEARLNGYNIPLLIDELLGLRIANNGKVDHQTRGTNDLADAVCGSIHLAMAYEEDFKPMGLEFKVLDIFEERERPNKREEVVPEPPQIPEELQQYIGGLQVL